MNRSLAWSTFIVLTAALGACDKETFDHESDPGRGAPNGSDSSDPDGTDAPNSSDISTCPASANPASLPAPGACGSEWVQHECTTSQFDPCPAGTYRDFSPDSPCSICVSGEPEKLDCEAARVRYRAFVEHIIDQRCINFCQSDSDCSVLQISNRCASGCDVPLYGGIDEEFEPVAADFADAWCTACGNTEPSWDFSTHEVACIDNICQLVD